MTRQTVESSRCSRSTDSTIQRLQGCHAHSCLFHLPVFQLDRRVAAEFERPKLRFGYLGPQRLEEAALLTLADLPSLEVLRGRVLGALNAPATQLVALLNTPASQMARVLKARADQGA